MSIGRMLVAPHVVGGIARGAIDTPLVGRLRFGDGVDDVEFHRRIAVDDFVIAAVLPFLGRFVLVMGHTSRPCKGGAVIRLRRMSRLAGVSMVLLASAVALPPPEGPFAVGRTRFIITDTGRPEAFDPERRRGIDVAVWYPAVDAARQMPRAAYLLSGPEEVRSFASLFGNRGLLDDIVETPTHAAADAEPRGDGRPFPLLFFSHGYTGSASASTSLLEDLASHGYVVVSIAHPFEATAATLGDGRVVSMLGDDGKFRPATQAVFDEWKEEDATLARVNAAPTGEEKIALLRRYLTGAPRTAEALRRWVEDGRAVLNQLSALPADRPIAKVMAAANTSRFGIAGHSMGGVMAAAWCAVEPRCAAALNLDGSPQYGDMIDSRMDRPMLMVYSARPARLGVSDVLYRRATSRYYRVDVSDTKHLDFTDMALWPLLRARNVTGALPAADAIAATRTIVREYFDQELRGRRSPLLSGARKYKGLSVSAPAADR